jgi:hypothetical protein
MGTGESYSRDKADGIAARVRDRRPRNRRSIPGMDNRFISSKMSRLAIGPIQPPIQWAPENLTPGLKRSERETDRSPSHVVPKLKVSTATSPLSRLHVLTGQLQLCNLKVTVFVRETQFSEDDCAAVARKNTKS